MGHSQRKAVEKYRQQLVEKGVVRLEVQAVKEDASLLRRAAKILRGPPEQAEKMRVHLRQAVQMSSRPDLKALLASAPLEGIDLTRPRDFGRDVDL